MMEKSNRWIKKLCFSLIFIFGFTVMITYMPSAIAGEEKVIERGPYAYYPELFSGRGILESVSKHHVVIGDSEYKLASGATFHTPIQKNVSGSLFKKGQPVGFILNDDGEISSVWKLNKLTDRMPI